MKEPIEIKCGNVIVRRNEYYQWGVIDLNGNIIVPYGKYAWIDGFDHGLARVRSSGRLVYSNSLRAIITSNRVIIGNEDCNSYNAMQRDLKPELYCKWGLINENGEEVLPLEYEEIWNFYGKNREKTRVKKEGALYEIDLTRFQIKGVNRVFFPVEEEDNEESLYFLIEHFQYGSSVWDTDSDFKLSLEQITINDSIEEQRIDYVDYIEGFKLYDKYQEQYEREAYYETYFFQNEKSDFDPIAYAEELKNDWMP